uniref:Uncharacterized protein n=1 Tax=Romanomermis culicivorax TaxID=13658 RepID=A0A915HM99_ROMCU
MDLMLLIEIMGPDLDIGDGYCCSCNKLSCADQFCTTSQHSKLYDFTQNSHGTDSKAESVRRKALAWSK